MTSAFKKNVLNYLDSNRKIKIMTKTIDRRKLLFGATMAAGGAALLTGKSMAQTVDVESNGCSINGVVSIATFEAIPDNEDLARANTIAIQAAVEKVESNGGVLVIPKGVYYTDEIIYIVKPIHIKGLSNSPNGSVIQCTKDEPVFLIKNEATGVSMSDFRIVGNRNIDNPQAPNESCNGIVCSTATLTLTDMVIEKTLGSGIKILSGFGYKIYRTLIRHCGLDGIEILASSTANDIARQTTNIDIVDCEISACLRSGIRCKTSNEGGVEIIGVRISNSLFHNLYNAIRFIGSNSCAQAVIHDSYFERVGVESPLGGDFSAVLYPVISGDNTVFNNDEVIDSYPASGNQVSIYDNHINTDCIDAAGNIATIDFVSESIERLNIFNNTLYKSGDSLSLANMKSNGSQLAINTDPGPATLTIDGLGEQSGIEVKNTEGYVAKLNGVTIHAGDINPALSGLDAPVASLYLSSYGGEGALYIKAGAGLNDWRRASSE